MTLPPDQLEKLSLHTAFAVHQIARWVATQDDVAEDVRERLRAHISAIEGVLVTHGHDWIKEEIQTTEAALHA